jgi:LysR family hydrogen peroxide-inducible transcriptional activator
MELHQLRYFVAAAEAGTMSLAAQRCRVAQPSLSQQIQKLEYALGAALFDRLGRGIALSPAGRALLPRARRILAEVQDAQTLLTSDVSEAVGRFAIGAIPTMAPYLLPELVTKLQEEFPRCDLAVCEDYTQNLLQQLADNQLDIALVSTPIEHELMHVEVIGSEPMLVVTPANHPLCHLETIGLPELRAQPTITLSEVHCLGRQISGFCSSRGLATRVACQTTQIATVLELVDRGLGVSLIPEMAAAREPSLAHRFLRLKRNPPTREIALARRKDRIRAGIGVRIGELLREQLAMLRQRIKV